MRDSIAGLAVAGLLAAAAFAQEQRPTEAGRTEGQEGVAPVGQDTMRQLLEREVEPQPGQYVYNPGGRRDPFINLTRPVEGTGMKGPRPVGMEGFLIQEVALKGIIKTKDGYIAMIVGPDGKSYFPKLGQRLYDGTITAMDQSTVTFRQEVTDPLSPVRVRDVRKSLYPSEEARQ